MQDNIAISVKNLTKVYHLYDNPIDRLKEALHPRRKSYHHDFYALNDVSFEIKKGETVGIIGQNGAGKSTLLKIITGVLTQTSGDVTVNGKIASLLELGAGFNPEMTGLENIYLNGTLMGFSEEEMSKKIDAILEFADIGEFISQPVKMYSSGMFARLAFAVAINVEPDVLIVDEVLSVGDEKFQRKCFDKIENLTALGSTVLFVTHSTALLEKICTIGLLFVNGQLIESGLNKEVVEAYRQLLYSSSKTSSLQESVKLVSSNKNQTELKIDNKLGVKIAAVWMYEFNNKKPRDEFLSYERAIFGIKIIAFDNIETVMAGIRIKTLEGIEVFGASSDYVTQNMTKLKNGDVYHLEFAIELCLCDGTYFITFAVADKDCVGGMSYHDKKVDILSFKIINPKVKSTGIAALKYDIDYQKVIM